MEMAVFRCYVVLFHYVCRWWQQMLFDHLLSVLCDQDNSKSNSFRAIQGIRRLWTIEELE